MANIPPRNASKDFVKNKYRKADWPGEGVDKDGHDEGGADGAGEVDGGDGVDLADVRLEVVVVLHRARLESFCVNSFSKEHRS